MQEQNDSEEITLQALMLADKVKQPEDLKAMFASLLGLIDHSPNRSASEYLEVMTKTADKKGLLSNS